MSLLAHRRPRARVCLEAVGVGVLALTPLPRHGLAQERGPADEVIVQGTVRDETTGEGIGQGVVRVSSSAGERLTFGLTDEEGDFRFELPREDGYTLTAQKFGFVFDSVFIRPPPGRARVRQDIWLSPDPIALRDLRVSVEGRCRRRSDSAGEAYEQFARLQPILRLIADAESQDRFAFRLALSEDLNRKNPRRLANEGLDIAKPDTVIVERPLWSPPAETVRRRGYVVRERDALRYYAPTADILASDSFRDAHCFSLKSAAHDTVLRIAFEPRDETRGVPDVSGVISVDEHRGVPLSLDFQYEAARDTIAAVELPGLRRHMEARGARRSIHYNVVTGPLEISSPIGGRLVFDEVTRGLLVTRRWELRIPVVYSVNEFSRGKVQVWPQTLELTRAGAVLEILRIRDSSSEHSGRWR